MIQARDPGTIDRVFHALSDQNRRAIIERLSRGPAAISEVARPFPMSLAGVVQHVQVLEKAGLVRTEKTGRVRTCHIEPDGLSLVEDWVRQRRNLWQSRFDRLGQMLDEDEAG